MLTWTYLPVIASGAEQVIQWGFTASTPQVFLRLKYSDVPTDDPFDADFNGDGLSNWQNLQQGSDPLAPPLLDTNGLPLNWEQFYNIPVGTDPDALAPRGDGLSYVQAFQLGLNPDDFYNGLAPTLAIVGGNSLTGAPGGFIPAPLTVSVTDGSGNALAGAPVTFTVGSGGGQLQSSVSGTPGSALTVLTDSYGRARAYFQLPATPSNASQITVAPGSGSYPAVVPPFTEFSDDGSGSTTYAAPFGPTGVVATLNGDGSALVEWTNNADPTDQTPIDVQYTDANGNLVTTATVPAGTTSYVIPAQPPSASPGAGDWQVQIDCFINPVQSYATLDAAQGSTNGNPVSLLALDDDNNVAFAYHTNLGDPSDVFNVETWTNGVLTDGARLPIPMNTTATVISTDPDTGNTVTPAILNFYPEYLNADGTLYGATDWSFETDDESYSNIPGSFFRCDDTPSPGVPPPLFLPTDAGNYQVAVPGVITEDPGLGNEASLYGVTSNGLTMGLLTNVGHCYPTTPPGGFITGGPDGFNDPLVYWMNATVFDDHSYSYYDSDDNEQPCVPAAPNVVSASLMPVGMNNNGWAVGVSSSIVPNHLKSCFWNADQQQLIPLDAWAIAINDSNDVLTYGTYDYAKSMYDGAYLITQGDPTQKKYLLANGSDPGMIPPLAQTEIRNVYPFLMSNRASNVDPGASLAQPVLYILLKADIRRSVASDDWEASTFLLRQLSDGTTDLQELPGFETSQIVSINANGFIAAIGSTGAGTNGQNWARGTDSPTPTPTPTASVSPPVQFKVELTRPGHSDSTSSTLFGPTYNATASIASASGYASGGVWRDIQFTDTLTFADGSTLTCTTGNNFFADTPARNNAANSIVSGQQTWTDADSPGIQAAAPVEIAWLSSIREVVHFRWFFFLQPPNGGNEIEVAELDCSYTNVGMRNSTTGQIDWYTTPINVPGGSTADPKGLPPRNLPPGQFNPPSGLFQRPPGRFGSQAVDFANDNTKWIVNSNGAGAGCEAAQAKPYYGNGNVVRVPR